MKFFSVVFALLSASAAMAAAVPEAEIPGKLVTRAEFELAERQAGLRTVKIMLESDVEQLLVLLITTERLSVRKSWA
ncbi:hypothetical protein FSARC_10367 [Fusarium sarcochroum]|uniref:Uncharacterized protein n=1 Tax=Fusarium sarcochroum TaxID=1208366 RepID=A0A8H4X3N9_9HYPO|nr:hypothetical protein FSARC_10367 [Fusarium sarcochroum]